jgi:acyl-CoA thioester hydrolase
MADFHFYHPTEVRYGDLDPQGHVNNAKYLTYFEQARVYYLIHLGLFDKDQSFMEIGLIVADIHIAYHAPTHYGDEIKTAVRTKKIGGKSIVVEQAVVDSRTGKEMARGEVVMVAYDYHAGNTIPVPDHWREKITAFERLNV